MKRKKSFILYLDQQEVFNKLPDEYAGKLIKHIFSYVNQEGPETEDLLIEVAFSSIKQTLKRDLEKWEAQMKQRSEAGKRSAAKRAELKDKGSAPVERKATTVESRSTKSTDSVSVSVSDSVSDSEKPKSPSAPDDAREIFEYWRQVMGKPASTKLTDGRMTKIRARLKSYSVEEVKKAIDGCAGSEHHMGKNRKSNPEGKIYDDLTLICRSDEKLEMFIGYTSAVSAKSQRDSELQDWITEGGGSPFGGTVYEHEG